MSNNTNEPIERRELTPFDMINGNDTDPRILDLNDNHEPALQQRQITNPQDVDPGDDPNLEPVDGTDDGANDGTEPKDDPNLNKDGDDPKDDPANDGGDEDDPEYDVKIKANLAKYAAEALIAQGGLPDDFEITEDITEADLDKAYVAFKEETLRNQIRQEEVTRLAEEEGITPEMIQEMKLKHYGVQDPEIQELNALAYLSTYQFDEKAESFEEDARQFLSSYYALKGITESRISKMVDRDLDDEELVGVLTEAQKDLGGDYAKLDGSIKEKARLAKETADNKRAENRQKVNSLLTQDGFAGRTKEELEIVRKALFDKTEIVVGSDGKRYRTTLYYKRQMEARADLEKNLQSKINFILGGDSTTLKNKEREKTTRKIMNRLNNYVDVDVKPKTTDKNASKSTSNNREGSIQRVEIN